MNGSIRAGVINVCGRASPGENALPARVAVGMRVLYTGIGYRTSIAIVRNYLRNIIRFVCYPR